MKPSQYITGLQHIGIPTTDIAKTIAFYENLGFTLSLRTVNEAAGEAVAFLELKGLVVETWENGQAVGKPGAIDHFALDVTDVDALFQRLQADGHTFLDEEVRFLPFWERGVRFFNILGPNGETIEFCQRL